MDVNLSGPSSHIKRMQQSSSSSSTSSTMSVKLIVKPSYQPFNDIEIECQEDWTILKIKQHIAEVYPFKPDVKQQKLIYSGKLLNDNKTILKDILQSTTNIFHLVYNMPKKPSSTAAPQNILPDGLRQRVKQGTTNTDAPQVLNSSSLNPNTIPQIITAEISSSASNNCPINNSNGNSNIPYAGNMPSGQFPNDMLAQQMAMQNWMHQVYLQYMNQCMNLSSYGARPETPYIPNFMPAMNVGANVWGSLPQMPFIPQNFPQLSNMNFGGNMNVNDVNTAPVVTGPAIVINQGAQNEPVIAAIPPNAAQPVPNVAAVVAQEQAQPQRRFPNIVQEEQENLDWLDVFYSLSRGLLLITLVYLYSSPLRLMVAITIALTIYLYHIGVLRAQRPPEANNNINNNNLNRQQPAAAVVNNQPAEANNAGDEVNMANDVQPQLDTPAAQNQVREGEQSVATAVAAVRGEDTIQLVPEENNRTSVMAFVKTFVVSFFTSLLPETPAL